MTGKYDEGTKQRPFNSVQHFWNSENLDGQAAYVRKGRFEGRLQKGVVEDGKLREFRCKDLERGMVPDTLIVLHLLNDDQVSNYDRMQPPPRRTGLFSAFMDEVEEAAAHAGCQRVRVVDVFNEFLPEKLEARGYKKVAHSDDPNPDYVKGLPHR